MLGDQRVIGIVKFLLGAHKQGHAPQIFRENWENLSGKSGLLGNGRNTVSRVLFRRRELTEFYGKLGEFCEKLGEFALAHK